MFLGKNASSIGSRSTLVWPVLVACGFQAALAQTHLHGNQNIVVPASGIHVKGHAHTNYLIYLGPDRRHGPFTGSAGAGHALSLPPSGYAPADIQGTYGMPPDGGTAAIAIVDAFDDPTALSEFNVFSAQYGLPQEASQDATASSNQNFQVVYASGARPTASSSWAGEAALDLEWAHAMAPNAKIYLVEAASDYNTDLDAAVEVAKRLTGVYQVSMSWGLDEYSSETQEDSVFQWPYVTFFSAAGDIAATPTFPAQSPNVIGVGGTSLQLDQNGAFVSETGWVDGGGGPSLYEPRPAYQDSIYSLVGSQRANPDIAAIADPNYGLAVYSDYGSGGWLVAGGTSASTAICAGIANTRGFFAYDSQSELGRLYGGLHNSMYADITSGGSNSYHAGPGWDFSTGYGVPYGLYPANYVTYSALLAEIQYGSVISGSVWDLGTVDGNVLTVQTAPDNSWQIAEQQVNYTVDREAYKFLVMQLNLSVAAAPGSTLEVDALNNNTGQYDQILLTQAQSAISPYIAFLPNASDYVDGGYHVQFLIRSYARQSQPYLLQIDQAQIAGQALP